MNNPLFFGFALSLFGLLLLLINTIVFLLKVKEHNKVYVMVTTYLVVMFFVETFCNITGYLYPGENTFNSHIYFNSQFLLLSVFFYRIFNNSVLRRIVTINYILITSIILIGYIIDFSTFWVFNLFEIVSTSSMLICYILIHLFRTLNKEKHYFFFSIGLVLYLICSSLIFISGDYELVFLRDPYIDIWVFNTLFYILYQFLIFKEWFYLNKRK